MLACVVHNKALGIHLRKSCDFRDIFVSEMTLCVDFSQSDVVRSRCVSSSLTSSLLAKDILLHLTIWYLHSLHAMYDIIYMIYNQ